MYKLVVGSDFVRDGIVVGLDIGTNRKLNWTAVKQHAPAYFRTLAVTIANTPAASGYPQVPSSNKRFIIIQHVMISCLQRSSCLFPLLGDGASG